MSKKDGFVKDLTEENFSSEVLLKPGLTVVDFGAAWCAPCLALEPILEQLAQEYPSIPVYSVNVDKEMDLASRYGIRSLPTVLVFKNGEVVEQLLGKQPGAKYKEILVRETQNLGLS